MSSSAKVIYSPVGILIAGSKGEPPTPTLSLLNEPDTASILPLALTSPEAVIVPA